MLQWTWKYRYFFKILISIIWNIYISISISISIYPETGLVDVVVLFSIFLRNFHIVFHKGSTILHCLQQYTRVQILPHPHQHLLSFVFLIMNILTNVRWYLTVVLTCSFLMISDIQYFSIYMSTICMPSLEKCVFKCLAYFANGWVFLLLRCKNSLYILKTNPLSDTWFANMFSY